ncbi:hypothetical protein BCR44DRAFT_1253131 [Catenaria anguillulae PL171]|uniref:YbaK/aminoacyl-tRNA synthetase-associated domain-containing protein n=1 Tax=Catenaria anguillulae PL171 TaxID=765915 RepID=A0A1Y2HGG6_9FUNG|nr:hypothetical protein BCR44DRAFT_1253131 [Catenaria anguillulae PL171]
MSDAPAAHSPNSALESEIQAIEQLYLEPIIVAQYTSRFLATASRAAAQYLRDARGDDSDRMPLDVARVVKGLAAIQLQGLYQLYLVESDYYSWSLARRMCRLNAPTRDHLCKTIVMENTKCPHDSIEDPKFSKYYAVIVQYTAKLNAQKLLNWGREIMDKKIPKSKYNFRLVPEDVSFKLTGFTNNGVSPFGMTCNLPIILAKGITELQPGIFWLGAGHVDWKVAVPVDEFVKATGCFVVDIY